MRFLRVSFLLMSLAATAGCGSTHPRAAQPSVAPMNRCALPPLARHDRVPVDRAELGKLIDDLFDSNQSDAPGAAVMVLHEGRVIAQHQYGLASIEHGVPFTPNHVVRLPYSDGREFIAIAAAVMEQDGLIRLDDPVRDHFPRLPVWSAPVRIRDLIHHRSGFVDEWSTLLMMHGSMTNRLDDAQFLRLLYEQPRPEVEPVTGYMYSNSDYGLLRLILDRAAGGELESYMRRRIFEPLGMRSTGLLDDPAVVGPNHANPFEAQAGGGYRHWMSVKTSPGGRYVIGTTACDLGRWAEAQSDPASAIHRALAQLMDGATTLPGHLMDGHYAFGHSIRDVAGTRVVWHEGVNAGTYLGRVPDRGYSVVAFGSRFMHDELRVIVDFLLDRRDDAPRPRFPTERAAVTAGELDSYVGRYVSTNIRAYDSDTLALQEVRITATADGLVAVHPWDRLDLAPVGPGRFTAHGRFYSVLVEFDAQEAGGPVKMVFSYDDGSPEERYERLPEWTPSPELLRRVAGTYHSAHLDYYWTMMVDEAGNLILRAPTLPDTPVEPYTENEFRLRHEKLPGIPARYWVRFHENERGEVTHLTVWNPRLMDHRFDRVERSGGRAARPD
jgi:CubicO group peptidase (beta-lactamase class C family)